MSTLPNYWCQLWGTHDPTWPRELRTFEPYLYRAKREVTETGEPRTVVIEGTVSNLPSQRHGNTALASRTAFDHGGHLIAARFGGPTCAENLVPMHGGINMRGGRWSNMEDQIARLLGDGKAMMRVSASYASPLDLRPERFNVELFPLGQRHFWSIVNFSPFLADPRSPDHWRVRIFEEIKRRGWNISTARRQTLLGCKDAARLETLCQTLPKSASAAAAFGAVGM